MDADKIVEYLKPQYLAIKKLDDGSIIAEGDLLYTRAIYFDCDMCGYGKRYCFSDRKKADEQFALITSSNDVPEGFTAQR